MIKGMGGSAKSNELVRAGARNINAVGVQQKGFKAAGAGGKQSVGAYKTPKGMKIEREGE
jgi:hypothetical protein